MTRAAVRLSQLPPGEATGRSSVASRPEGNWRWVVDRLARTNAKHPELRQFETNLAKRAGSRVALTPIQPHPPANLQTESPRRRGLKPILPNLERISPTKKRMQPGFEAQPRIINAKEDRPAANLQSEQVEFLRTTTHRLRDETEVLRKEPEEQTNDAGPLQIEVNLLAPPAVRVPSRADLHGIPSEGSAVERQRVQFGRQGVAIQTVFNAMFVE